MAISPDSIAPVARSTLQIEPLIETGVLFSIAARDCAISFWSMTFSRPWSCACVWKMSICGRNFRLVEQRREVEALRLPVVDGLRLVEHLHLPDHFIERAIAHLRHQLAHFLGDEEEEVDDVLGLADETLAQHGVLRRHAHRAGVEVALAHHDAAGRDQRRGGEAELVGAEQRADDHVAAGAQAAVDLHRDARAQAVVDERLVRLGEADLPRAARVLDRGQRRGARAALVARDRHVVGARPWRRRPRPCRRRPRRRASPTRRRAG